MAKIQLTAGVGIFPLPVTLVGANVAGKPNFLAIAWCGVMADSPPTVYATLSKGHYTRKGILETGAFSMNIPTAAMVEQVDFCGCVSGHKTDKSGLFMSCYGPLKTAPMIAECPVSMECRLVRTIELAGDEIFIGEVMGTYAEEACLTDGRLDAAKIAPIAFSMYDHKYWGLGECLGRAFSITSPPAPPLKKKGNQ